jgi:hypothetical protein
VSNLLSCSLQDVVYVILRISSTGILHCETGLLSSGEEVMIPFVVIIVIVMSMGWSTT